LINNIFEFSKIRIFKISNLAALKKERKNMTKRFLITIGLLGALSVALGAFGAHILRGNISSENMETFNLANNYLMFHALALLGIAFANRYISRAYTNVIYYFFVIGIALFSGSLLFVSLKELTGVGLGSLSFITPVGGFSLLLGWITLIFAGSSYTHNKGNK
jgi:uncharacterized membrane protein YgdD (TMEM256/DUF423 family)